MVPVIRMVPAVVPFTVIAAMAVIIGMAVIIAMAVISVWILAIDSDRYARGTHRLNSASSATHHYHQAK